MASFAVNASSHRDLTVEKDAGSEPLDLERVRLEKARDRRRAGLHG
jgi:hypothetical protein